MKRKIFLLLLNIIFFLNLIKINAQVALAFNGVNNYVSTNGFPVLNNGARTVDAWIKTTSSITTQMVICDWGSTTPNASRFTMNLINSKLRIEIGGVGFAGTTNLNTGQWFHVTAVYSPTITSGNNAFLYVNGSLEAAGTFTGYTTLTTTNTTGFRMGVRVDGINFFNGAIDEVKVYNYPRTQSQIAADTLEYCTTQPGLVAYYKLNEGVANSVNTGSTNAIDYSGNNNNGTLNSFTLTGSNSNWVPGRVRSDSPTITSNSNNNICSGTSLSLSTNAISNFTWNTGNSTSTLIVVSPSVTTSYSISALNSQSCIMLSSITITVNNSTPTLTVVVAQNPICLGASTSFSASGAITYSWTGGLVNGQAFTPSVTTTYTLSAANACGVVNSIQTITVTPLQITTLVSPTIVCEGYTCNVSASASANGFTWTPGNQTGSNIIIAPLATTIYTVSATNGTCFGTQTLQVTTKTTPTITVSNSLVTICEGQSTSITANGAGNNGSYLWSSGSGTNANVSLSPTINTVYTATGTNSLGCSSNAQAIVLVNAKPSFTISASSTLICIGETVTLNANGNATYTWSSGVNSFSTNEVPVTGFNVYTLAASNINNTCTATQTIGVSVITPSINYTSSVAICSGASATLNASGANTYTWNNLPMGSSGMQVYSPSSTSVYTLIANTQSITTNCLSTHFATIVVNPNPTVSVIASNTFVICQYATNTLTANGANSYTWIGISSTSSQVIVTPSSNITYTVVGKTTSGCVSSAQILVRAHECVDLIERNLSSVFSIYPNPTKNECYINSEIELNFELFDFKGSLVKTIQVNKGINFMDVSDLSTGVYIFKIKNDSFLLYRKVVIEK